MGWPRIRPENMTRREWQAKQKREKRHMAKGGTPEPEPFVAYQLSDDLTDLVNATRAVISFESLCDKLGKSPSEVRKLLEHAKNQGISLEMGNDHIHLSPQEQIRTVQNSRILPTTSKRQQIGVLSDLHCGSKYCMRAQIKDCVSDFYERGIRNILVPGDLLDGCYKHGVFELSHVGLEDQTKDLFETIPALPGLAYHCITGNHDHTFTELTGVNVGAFIVGQFKERGRKDIRFYGDCGAFIEICGAVVHLWHPMKGVAYAKSYQLQKQIEKYGSGEKPHILLAGHWHQFAVVEDRGVFGIACPTFQASGSAFSKRLGGQPALGGLIVCWEIAGKDLVRNLSVERRRYFELELPTKISTREW